MELSIISELHSYFYKYIIYPLEQIDINKYKDTNFIYPLFLNDIYFTENDKLNLLLLYNTPTIYYGLSINNLKKHLNKYMKIF